MEGHNEATIREIEYERPWMADYQIDFVDCPARYTVIEAATKTGKTVSCIYWLFEQALFGKDGNNYWWVAPVYKQARIAFKRMKRFIQPKEFFEAKETTLEIRLASGAIISFVSGENPDNLYGEDVYAAVIDESTRVREESWIALRTTLTATKGPVKIIGNVKGRDNWAYRMAKAVQAGEIKNGRYFQFTAWDAVRAGILDEDEIMEAKATLAPEWFAELYECIPRNPVDDPWIYHYDEEKHTTGFDGWPSRRIPLYLSFDFNVNPMTVSIHQHTPAFIHTYDEFYLPDHDIFKVCRAIRDRYPGYLYEVVGDSTGKARHGLSPGLVNYYQVIEKELSLNKRQIRVQPNPSPSENRVLCNTVLYSHPEIRIHSRCKELIKDFRLIESAPDDSLVKNKDARRSHLLDTWRYYINAYHRDFIRHWQAA